MADKINACLAAKVQAGRLSKEQADQVMKRVGEFEAEHAQTMTMSAAERAAAQRLARKLAEEAAEAQRRAKLVARAKKNVDQAAQHPKGVAAGMMSLLSFDRWGVAQWGNVETRTNTLLGQFQALFRDGLENYAPKFLRLVQDRDGLERFVRELWGEGTGDALARQAASSWARAAETARRLANEAGADIKELKGWLLPQAHDEQRIVKATYPTWRAFVWDRLDRSKMRNATTGAILDDQGLELALKNIYAEITTGGLVNVQPGSMGKASLAKQMARQRYLHFKDADSWIGYHKEFGNPDTYGMLMNHLRGTASKVAMLQRLGPNPDHMLRYMEDLIRQERGVLLQQGEKPGR